MVYDSERKPVAACSVALEDGLPATTDVNGRFMFDSVPYGHHVLTFTKQTFEDYRLELDFSAKTQIVYARVISREGLLAAARASLVERSWAEAAGLLDRADKLGRREPLSSFLRATLAFRQKHYEEAARLLERLSTSDYRDPTILVFLADLYQYHLSAPDKAAQALRSALLIRDDSEIVARLEGLTASLHTSPATAQASPAAAPSGGATETPLDDAAPKSEVP